MISRWCALCLTLTLAVLVTSHAQTSPPQSPAKADYSQESAVIEEMASKVVFDNDGNSTREQTSRVRVQTDAGVKEWGLLKFPFQSATQTVEIDYVRVHKADGSTLITPPDNVQDLDSEITRSAPFYSDLREKHVAVKGLGKGDILEYQAHWHSTKPLIPGQFWFQYNFQRQGIVLDERVEIRVPSERAVKVKGPQATQTVTTEAGSRVYTWTYSRLQSAKEPGSDQKTQTESARGLFPPPDVQISSFQSWEEVGRWYWNLQKDRIEPTPAIRAKAAELTQSMTDDAAKLQALYSFVSTQYRYIGIAFGIGRYQPHAADDVLTNSYGDCKDKHTLLASLLQASGITLYPALISSSFKIDPDVPSPAQFDHIIGYLPQSNNKEKGAIWLDTTIEVAPLGYLVPRLREKPALVMSGDKSIGLVTTPSDPLFPDTEAFKIDGKLSADGTFDAKIEDTSRGDSEVVLRTAFRQVAQPQWKDLMQRISYAMGYAGTVSEISASTPEAIGGPFRISYSYNRKDYPDWKSNQRFTVPGMPFFVPPVRDDEKYPLWLGPLLEGVSDSRVELPPGYAPQTPSNVDLKYDFAEYHASYSQDHGVLIAKRRLVTKLHEVPVGEFDDYRNFVKNMQDDINQYVYMQTASSGAAAVPKAAVYGPANAFLTSIWALPASTFAEANQLERDAHNAMNQDDRSAVVGAFKHALEVDPKFTRAWLELTIAYMTYRQTDNALEAVRKAIDSDPKQIIARKMYAHVLVTLRRPDEQAEALRAALKIAPDDPDSNSELGVLLVQQKRYDEAVPYLETAAKSDKSQASQSRLAVAYMRSGQAEKAEAILDEAVKANPGPDMWNDVGYELADANVDLPKALEYAQNAVNAQEKESHGTDLSNVLPQDLQCTKKIGMFWDTLGWVDFRLGHLDEAESYLHAAWLLTQGGVEADHLGQVYEQQKKTVKAIHMYRLALATPEGKAPNGTWDETRRRLEHLTGAKSPTAMELLRGDPNGSELSQMRTVKLKRLVPGTAEAEFFLIFGPGPKVEGLQFISGSNKIRSAGGALLDANFQVAFPQHSSARLVRRAILMCSEVSGCNLVLFTPESVNSVK
ncbi:MAG: DUF3857 domain-containing protein [Terriglobales bacterium]